MHILSKLEGMERLVEDLIHKTQRNQREQIVSLADSQTNTEHNGGNEINILAYDQ